VKLFDFETKKRWLFCMTHPDDEISICATIKRLTDAGHDVYLSWTHNIPVREAEARSTAELLGVPADRLYFHHSTDATTCLELRQLLPRFLEMVDESKPDVAVCGAFEQGHLDHDSTNYLLNRVFAGPVLEIPFYHTYVNPKIQVMNRFSVASGQEVLTLTKEEQRFKLEVAKRYKSQNIWQVLLAYEIFQFVTFRKPELRTREIMRLQTHKNFRVPNHPEPIRRRVESHRTWKLWLESLDAVEKGTL
jgi:LmbE family N-acetylglucosaminyl deacetylase